MEQNQEIDLTTIDWNNLTLEQFHQISEDISDRNKLIKENKERKNRSIIHNVLVKLRGNTYEIPSNLFERLKNMKSDKSKEKLIDETISLYSPILTI
jgi:hypothetical protein